MNDRESKATATGALERDTIHDLLADERRRHVLSCLSDRDSMALPDLADEIARREHDAPLPQVPEDRILRVYLSLWHTHVPKLTEAGVATYDQDEDRVALAENADALEQFAPFGATRGGE